MLGVIATLLVIMVVLGVLNGRRIRKQNENSCSGSCSSCMSKGTCDSEDKNE